MHEVIAVCVSLLLLLHCMIVAIAKDDWTRGIAQLSLLFPDSINILELELKLLLCVVKTRFFTFVNELIFFSLRKKLRSSKRMT